MNLLINVVYYVSGGSTLFGTDRNQFDDGFIFVIITNNVEEIKFIPSPKNTQ